MSSVRLDIYVRRGCLNCQESMRLVNSIAQEYPQVRFNCIDVAVHETPDIVFATPTFLLNDRLLSLGNPSQGQLRAALCHALDLVPSSS